MKKKIFQEIRSVFDGPMGVVEDFPFKILQTCGGGSKTLATPVLSSSFKWTASAVAGRNAKAPIYILAEDDLVVSLTHQLYTIKKLSLLFPVII